LETWLKAFMRGSGWALWVACVGYFTHRWRDMVDTGKLINTYYSLHLIEPLLHCMGPYVCGSNTCIPPFFRVGDTPHTNPKPPVCASLRCFPHVTQAQRIGMSKQGRGSAFSNVRIGAILDNTRRFGKSIRSTGDCWVCFLFVGTIVQKSDSKRVSFHIV
jgi:hypothetical protein